MYVDHGSSNDEGQSPFVKRMAERIRGRAASQGVSRSELADAAGVRRSAMTKYWSGDRQVPVEAIPLIADHLSTTVYWLLTGIEGQTSLENMVEVREIDLAYGLGGTYADGPVEVRLHQFPRAWLEGITSTPPASLIIARGRGDSMQPTLQDGDMVMIDRSQIAVREQDAIWALTLGDIAMIKRLRVKGERVFIQSDNERVSDDEVHHEEINIVGRVIFIGRRV